MKSRVHTRSQISATISIVLICGMVTALLFRSSSRRIELDVARTLQQRVETRVLHRLAPEFTYAEADSVRVFSASTEGKPILLYVHQSTCEACQRFLSDFKEFATVQGLPADLHIVVVPRGDTASARHDLQSLSRTTLLHPLDLEAFIESYAAHAVPYLARIDSAGRIRKLQVGYAPQIDFRAYVE